MAGATSPSQQLSVSTPSALVHKSSSKQPLKTYSKRPIQDASAPLSKRQRIELPQIPVQSTSKGVEPLPATAPSIHAHKLSLTSPLGTYSKGASQHTSEPSSDRQRIKLPTLPAQSTTKSGVLPPSTPALPLPKKRSISQYFKPVSRTKTSSSPQSSNFSSDSIQNVGSSLPSSPPSPGIFYIIAPPKKRARRRLVTRGPLALMSMSDINTRGSKGHEKGKSKAVDDDPSDSEGSSGTLNLMEGSDQGLRLAARDTNSGEEEEEQQLTQGVWARPSMDDIPRSDPIDIPGVRQLSTRELLMAIVPGRPNMFSGPPLASLTPMATNRNLPFGSQETLVEDSTPAQEAPYWSGVTMAAAQQLARSLRTNPAISIEQGPFGSRNAARNVAPGSANLIQAQLDLGPQTVWTCSTCGLTCNRTIAADVRAHDEYHEAFTDGEPVVGLMTTPRCLLASINTGIGQGDYVVVVDRSSTEGWKRLAQTVLEKRVDKELGSVPITADVLWSSIADPAAKGPVANQVERFKVYLYIRRWVPRLGRVVSLLLAERVKTGYETNRSQLEADEFGSWPATVPHIQTIVSNRAHEAVLGINKFWTIKDCRRRGFGKLLLDHARQNFVRSYIIPRIHVAWTQPTDDGASFAKAYMEDQADYDFLTYDDHL